MEESATSSAVPPAPVTSTTELGGDVTPRQLGAGAFGVVWYVGFLDYLPNFSLK